MPCCEPWSLLKCVSPSKEPKGMWSCLLGCCSFPQHLSANYKELPFVPSICISKAGYIACRVEHRLDSGFHPHSFLVRCSYIVNNLHVCNSGPLPGSFVAGWMGSNLTRLCPYTVKSSRQQIALGTWPCRQMCRRYTRQFDWGFFLFIAHI